ncbi:WD40/YVTN/BNR-like repeat-containing protein (plasmid) [Ralstonia sp. 25C]|uniref:WD40/YVTN/BNR-like repeat-containing protein n=1 Tax=Ralstonia sp. 25C TaxID=3447363 RepID=UPI003F75668A
MNYESVSLKAKTLAQASLVWITLLAAAPLAFANDAPTLRLHPAERVAAATKTAILGAARAGGRIVAVGDHGVILLSDDDGRTFRQARSVPTDLTLTAVSFADSAKGWAVGHGGVILATDDGGETWRLQREDLKVDQPLFSVFFRNASEGWAVGLWSLVLHTSDGGRTWTTVTLPPPEGAKKADKNLYAIFPGKDDALFITSEQGVMLRSVNGGANWTYLQTGYKGSLWTGVTLKDGTVVAGGLRGSLLASSDNGTTWATAKSAMQSSITALAQVSGGTVVAVGLDGAVLKSNDGGKTFAGVNREDRAPLTAVLPNADGRLVLFSGNGPVAASN